MWVSRVILVFFVSPVLFVCAFGGRWFMGRAGGIVNALRTRTLVAHTSSTSPPRGNKVDGLPRAASFARDLGDQRAKCANEPAGKLAQNWWSKSDVFVNFSGCTNSRKSKIVFANISSQGGSHSSNGSVPFR